MCTGRQVGNRRPACYLRDRLASEDKDPGLSGVTVAGEEDGLGLALQSSKGDLRMTFLPGNGNGGIQPPEVHVRRHDKGHPLKESVPSRIRRGLVLGFQCGLGEPPAVVRHRHDLELDRAGIVAGEQMDRKLYAAVGRTVGNELGIRPWLGGFQLRQNIAVAFSGKEKRPPGVPEAGGLVGKGIQFICQGQLADIGANVMYGAEQVPQMGDGGDAGAAPGICTPVPCERREEQGWGFRKLRHCRGERIYSPLVCGQDYPGQAKPPLEDGLPVGWGDIRYRAVSINRFQE